MAALVIGVVVLSGALGLLAHRLLTKRVRTQGQDSAEGVPLTDLLAPVRILVAHQIGTTPSGASPPCDQSGAPLAGS